MSPVELVRISLGTAVQIGLEAARSFPPSFTTAFLMTYCEDGCVANCAFCPQARESKSAPHLLSRIGWPEYQFSQVLEGIERNHSFARFCIQSLNYPGVVNDVEFILKQLGAITDLPISVCIHPLKRTEMERLHNAGASNIGIAIDAGTPTVFDDVKGLNRRGPYKWEQHLASLETAEEVFGTGKVTTHLIIGLGESEPEAAKFLLDMHERGIMVGLFAFTGVRGTALENREQPAIGVYRRVQVLRYLLANNLINPDQVAFDEEEHLHLEVREDWLRETLSSGVAFRTSGCAGCNRPYYTERPRGPMYNYPRPLSKDEINTAISETELVL